MPITNRQIFINAAERIDSGEEKYSCLALWLGHDDTSRRRHALSGRYARAFDVEINTAFNLLYPHRTWDEISLRQKARVRKIRVLMLLFAAEYFSL